MNSIVESLIYDDTEIEKIDKSKIRFDLIDFFAGQNDKQCLLARKILPEYICSAGVLGLPKDSPARQILIERIPGENFSELFVMNVTNDYEQQVELALRIAPQNISLYLICFFEDDLNTQIELAKRMAHVECFDLLDLIERSFLPLEVQIELIKKISDEEIDEYVCYFFGDNFEAQAILSNKILGERVTYNLLRFYKNNQTTKAIFMQLCERYSKFISAMPDDLLTNELFLFFQERNNLDILAELIKKRSAYIELLSQNYITRNFFDCFASRHDIQVELAIKIHAYKHDCAPLVMMLHCDESCVQKIPTYLIDSELINQFELGSEIRKALARNFDLVEKIFASINNIESDQEKIIAIKSISHKNLLSCGSALVVRFENHLLFQKELICVMPDCVITKDFLFDLMYHCVDDSVLAQTIARNHKLAREIEVERVTSKLIYELLLLKQVYVAKKFSNLIDSKNIFPELITFVAQEKTNQTILIDLLSHDHELCEFVLPQQITPALINFCFSINVDKRILRSFVARILPENINAKLIISLNEVPDIQIILVNRTDYGLKLARRLIRCVGNFDIQLAIAKQIACCVTPDFVLHFNDLFDIQRELIHKVEVVNGNTDINFFILLESLPDEFERLMQNFSCKIAFAKNLIVRLRDNHLRLLVVQRISQEITNNVVLRFDLLLSELGDCAQPIIIELLRKRRTKSFSDKFLYHFDTREQIQIEIINQLHRNCYINNLDVIRHFDNVPAVQFRLIAASSIEFLSDLSFWKKRSLSIDARALISLMIDNKNFDFVYLEKREQEGAEEFVLMYCLKRNINHIDLEFILQRTSLKVQFELIKKFFPDRLVHSLTFDEINQHGLIESCLRLIKYIGVDSRAMSPEFIVRCNACREIQIALVKKIRDNNYVYDLESLSKLLQHFYDDADMQLFLVSSANSNYLKQLINCIKCDTPAYLLANFMSANNFEFHTARVFDFAVVLEAYNKNYNCEYPITFKLIQNCANDLFVLSVLSSLLWGRNFINFLCTQAIQEDFDLRNFFYLCACEIESERVTQEIIFGCQCCTEAQLALIKKINPIHIDQKLIRHFNMNDENRLEEERAWFLQSVITGSEESYVEIIFHLAENVLPENVRSWSLLYMLEYVKELIYESHDRSYTLQSSLIGRVRDHRMNNLLPCRENTIPLDINVLIIFSHSPNDQLGLVEVALDRSTGNFAQRCFMCEIHANPKASAIATLLKNRFFCINDFNKFEDDLGFQIAYILRAAEMNLSIAILWNACAGSKNCCQLLPLICKVLAQKGIQCIEMASKGEITSEECIHARETIMEYTESICEPKSPKEIILDNLRKTQNFDPDTFHEYDDDEEFQRMYMATFPPNRISSYLLQECEHNQSLYRYVENEMILAYQQLKNNKRRQLNHDSEPEML